MIDLISNQELEANGVDPERLHALYKHIQSHIDSGLYPGAAVALARHGKLLAKESFGLARLPEGDAPAVMANDETLWLLYSQTKPLTAAAIWVLLERGVIGVHDPVSLYLKNFNRNQKENVTIYHLLTHQAGFPNAVVPTSVWRNNELIDDAVCNFELEWEPGSRVHYHASSAHWVLAAIMNAVTGEDYRRFIYKVVLEPLKLSGIWMGVPDNIKHKVCGAYERTESGEHVVLKDFAGDDFRRAGAPGSGGFARPQDMAMFYQCLLGLCGSKTIVSRATMRYVTSNQTGDRIDEFFGIPMNRGLGVHVRGHTPVTRGLGTMASPSTFGHGGMGTSYSWADPESGVSFSYITNSRLSEPAHSLRLDRIAALAQSAIVK